MDTMGEMNNSRYHILKSKLLKTLKSMRHMLSQKTYKQEAIESYTKRIHSGVMNLLKADTREFMAIITEPRTIRVTIKGQFMADVEIVPSSIIGPVSYMDIAPEQLSDTIKQYIQVYVHDIISGDKKIDPPDYADIILENYLNLTKTLVDPSEPKKRYTGKLQLY